jgi:hypothetical protein
MCYNTPTEGATPGARAVERDIPMTIDQEPIDSPTGWVAKHVQRYIETNGADGHIW